MSMNIYFSGMGGVGIGPLVEIASDMGYSVQGSDLYEGLMTEELEKRGIPVSIGEQDGTFLQSSHDAAPIDWFVYTAALPDNHPELVLARELGIRVSKRDEFLSFLIKEKNLKLIAVSGSHGKTTTTGMLVWMFTSMGIPVSYSIGTTLSFAPNGKYDPESEYFIYECDEYDRNLLHFSPYLSIIPSVDYDHPDSYPTVEDYLSAFRQFVHQSDHAILWQKDADYIKTRDPSAWCIQEDELLKLPLNGEHNRRNGTLVLKALEHLRIGENITNRDTLAEFPGTDRRFEKLGENLYSDYGHHPAEIAATLQLAKELNNKVVLIYQPHQNLRQYQMREEYYDKFELANEVYWVPTYLSREDPNLAILTPEQLYESVTNKEAIQSAELNDELWEVIQQARAEEKLVLAMGAGTIDGWIREQLESND